MEIIILIFALIFGFFLLSLSIGAVLLIAPFFKASLLDNPSKSDNFALFVAPEEGRSNIIMRGGNIEHIIHGKESGETLAEDEQFKNMFLRAYDQYVFKFGLRLIGIPGVHRVFSYDLPRYRKVEEGGKMTYLAVETQDPSRRTNHFRTQVTPWYNEFTSVDIEGVPFDVKCATNFHINKELVEKTAFSVESWNTLLDQALNAVVRGTVREKFTLADAIGKSSENIFEEHKGSETPRSEDAKDSVQGIILERLLIYKLKDGRTLGDIGIVINGFEILDFAPEGLSPAELEKLRAPALERRAAQARVMSGKAEAAYQDQVLAVLAKYPELAKANVDAEAFVKAAKAGTLDALAAALLKKLVS